MFFDIWVEGFLCTGMEGEPANAHYYGTVEASSFQEACDKKFADDGSYSPNNLTLWGCRIFNNEVDARKNFG